MLMNYEASQLKGYLETAMVAGLITFLHLPIYYSGSFIFKNVGSQPSDIMADVFGF